MSVKDVQRFLPGAGIGRHRSPSPFRIITTMKLTVLLLAFVVAMSASSQAADKAAPQFRAGAAAVDITPQESPVNMPGLFWTRN